MEFKFGDLVEVRDFDSEAWDGDAIFLADLWAIDKPVKTGRYVIYNQSSKVVYEYHQCRHRRPDLKVDDPVWVRHQFGFSNAFYPWLPRYFCGWDENGIKVWSDGKGSHTTNITTVFSEYRTTPPE